MYTIGLINYVWSPVILIDAAGAARPKCITFLKINVGRWTAVRVSYYYYQ